jgi:hypothetical protein
MMDLNLNFNLPSKDNNIGAVPLIAIEWTLLYSVTSDVEVARISNVCRKWRQVAKSILLLQGAGKDPPTQQRLWLHHLRLLQQQQQNQHVVKEVDDSASPQPLLAFPPLPPLLLLASMIQNIFLSHQQHEQQRLLPLLPCTVLQPLPVKGRNNPQHPIGGRLESFCVAWFAPQGIRHVHLSSSIRNHSHLHDSNNNNNNDNNLDDDNEQQRLVLQQPQHQEEEDEDDDDNLLQKLQQEQSTESVVYYDLNDSGGGFGGDGLFASANYQFQKSSSSSQQQQLLPNKSPPSPTFPNTPSPTKAATAALITNAIPPIQVTAVTLPPEVAAAAVAAAATETIDSTITIANGISGATQTTTAAAEEPDKVVDQGETIAPCISKHNKDHEHNAYYK